VVGGWRGRLPRLVAVGTGAVHHVASPPTGGAGDSGDRLWGWSCHIQRTKLRLAQSSAQATSTAARRAGPLSVSPAYVGWAVAAGDCDPATLVELAGGPMELIGPASQAWSATVVHPRRLLT